MPTKVPLTTRMSLDFELMVLAFLKKDGFKAANRELDSMDDLEVEQLEAACRVILAAIEARR